ncbi:hypothetical protein TNCV_3179841 [Trichonephila clavipes]|nr:hypothetical protein TNCV_3179841 [Trichonephila clavipes]
MSASISTLTAHTCQKQTEPVRDGSVGCLRAHWPWEKKPPSTMVRSWLSVKLQRMLSAVLAPANVVSFRDSQASILVSSRKTPTDCLTIIQFRTKTAELISYGWTVALQWVPSHVGIPGNGRADQKAKQEA